MVKIVAVSLDDGEKWINMCMNCGEIHIIWRNEGK